MQHGGKTYRRNNILFSSLKVHPFGFREVEDLDDLKEGDSQPSGLKAIIRSKSRRLFFCSGFGEIGDLDKLREVKANPFGFENPQQVEERSRVLLQVWV